MGFEGVVLRTKKGLFWMGAHRMTGKKPCFLGGSLSWVLGFLCEFRFFELGPGGFYRNYLRISTYPPGGWGGGGGGSY